MKARELLDTVLDDGSWVPWDGPGAESVLTGEGRLRQRPVAVVVSDFDVVGGSIGVAAAERLVRAVERATQRRLPLLSVIDTPGAAASVESERGGLAGEIARCLADLVTLPAPTVCLLLGQGAGGSALALLPADRVRSRDLLEDGVVDGVLQERPDAAHEPEPFCQRLGRRLERELVAVMAADPGNRAARRADRYRRIGRP